MRRFGSLAMVGCVALAAAGCPTVTGPTYTERMGVISHYGDPVVVTAPATAGVGQSFEVAVRTYGNGCVSEGGTSVERQGPLVVDVTPWDRSPVDTDLACPDVLRTFDHRVTLTLLEEGTAEIRFHGIEQPGSSLLVVTREVVVVPE